MVVSLLLWCVLGYYYEQCLSWHFVMSASRCGVMSTTRIVRVG
jgi:hypothetical protein